jgi:hypothetical protein
MGHRFRIMAATLAVPVIGALGVGAASAASATAKPAVKSYTSTAVTVIKDRPDSGDHGDWADDNFSRSASVTLLKEVALSFCGGSTGTGHCYHWLGSVTDEGTFTTIIGATSPGNGSLNGGSPLVIGAAVTGGMSGSYKYDFYSSWKTAKKSLVPASENDHGLVPTGKSTTGAWPEQFFGNTAQFFTGGLSSNQLGTTGSWKYTAPPGADTACPAVSSQWTDGSPDWGSNAADGNIIAPDAAHC